jgi:hypothetical protein
MLVVKAGLESEFLEVLDPVLEGDHEREAQAPVGGAATYVIGSCRMAGQS